MGENEEAVAFVEGLVEEFAEGAEFGGVIGGGGGGDQAGVAADLAEPEELGEGGEAEGVFGGAGGGEVEEGALGALLGFAVEGGLGGLEVAVNDLLDLGGEFGGDGLFGAAEDVAGGFSAEALVVERAFLGLGAGGGGPEETGHEEGEKGAEVVERVFERGAGEEETAGGVKGAQGLGVAGAAVFDVLGFVGDDAGEVHGGKKFFVAGEGGVGGDDEVMGGEGGGIGEAALPVVDGDAELRGEAGGLAAPVFDEGGGADNEDGERRGERGVGRGELGGAAMGLI